MTGTKSSWRGRLLLVLVFVLIVAGAPAWSAGPIRVILDLHPDLESGRHAFAICVRCHLPEAWGNGDGTYPQLAGQHVNVLMKQLLDIRSGKRQNPLMYPFVQERTIGGYQSLADVVGYISTLPMNPAHTRGPWPAGTPAYEGGRRVYEQHCAACHGVDGAGSNERFYPRLQGQHYPYMMRQARLVRGGLREVDPAMAAVFKVLSDQDVARVLNYVSHLEVPAASKAPGPDWRNPDFE